MAESREIPSANPTFSTMASSIKLIVSDCDNGRQPETARLALNLFYCHFRLSMSSQSPGNSHQACCGRKVQICRWNLYITCRSSKDKIFPVLATVLPFPVSIVVAIAWGHFLRDLRGRKLTVGILMLSFIFSETDILFPVLQSDCYFRLSFNVAFICGHFLWACYGRKLCFSTRITIILTSESSGWITHHKRNISSVSK